MAMGLFLCCTQNTERMNRELPTTDSILSRQPWQNCKPKNETPTWYILTKPNNGVPWLNGIPVPACFPRRCNRIATVRRKGPPSTPLLSLNDGLGQKFAGVSHITSITALFLCLGQCHLPWQITEDTLALEALPLLWTLASPNRSYKDPTGCQ